jgi:hypothetical protein
MPKCYRLDTACAFIWAVAVAGFNPHIEGQIM